MRRCKMNRREKILWINMCIELMTFSLLIIALNIFITKKDILFVIICIVLMSYLYIKNFFNGYKLGWMYKYYQSK